MLYADYIKPIVDFIIAVFLLWLLLPFFGIMIVVLWVLQGRPLFFNQQRAGKYGQPFKVFKFRSMAYDEASATMKVTPCGKVLRRFSLDEWPQLFNVLKGEMSLVGPRPLMTSYTPRLDGNQKKRLNVKPGITGLTQISGANLLSWEDKFRLDSKYAEEQSFFNDLKILLKTPAAICKRRDKGNPVANF